MSTETLMQALMTGLGAVCLFLLNGIYFEIRRLNTKLDELNKSDSENKKDIAIIKQELRDLPCTETKKRCVND